MAQSLIRFRSIMLLATIVLGACATPIESSKDIKPGESLVIARSYEEVFYHKGTVWDSTPRIGTNTLEVTLEQVDPPKGRIRWKGNKDRLSVKAAKTSLYQFVDFEVVTVQNVYTGGHFTPDGETEWFGVEVRPGEAVYIGDIVARREEREGFSLIPQWNPDWSYRIEIRDNEAAAQAFFEEKFGDSGLTFTKRLMKKSREARWIYDD